MQREIEGMAEVKAAMGAVEIARDAYERESRYGYPQKAAPVLDRAEAVVTEIAVKYPEATIACGMERKAIYSTNYRKAAAYRQGIERIEAGMLPSESLKIADAEWSEAAAKAVENA
jgi:hypothetical protein